MCVEGGENVIPMGIVIEPYNYEEQIGHLKILIERFLEKIGGRGGLVAQQNKWVAQQNKMIWKIKDMFREGRREISRFGILL